MVDVLDTQCISFTCFMTPTVVHCFKNLSRAITEMLGRPVEPCVGMGNRRPRPTGRGRLSPHLIRQWVTVPRGWQDSPITSSDSAKQGCRERWREGRAAVHGSCHFPWSSPQWDADQTPARILGFLPITPPPRPTATTSSCLPCAPFSRLAFNYFQWYIVNEYETKKKKILLLELNSFQRILIKSYSSSSSY